MWSLKLIFFTGTSDFLGLNHYTTQIVEHNEHRGGDTDVEMSDDSNWPSTANPWSKVSVHAFVVSYSSKSYLLIYGTPYLIYIQIKLLSENKLIICAFGNFKRRV
jgi:hypothetical protein